MADNIIIPVNNQPQIHSFDRLTESIPLQMGFVRATAENIKKENCLFCKLPTDRVMAVIRGGEGKWIGYHICDFCLKGIADMQWDFLGR